MPDQRKGIANIEAGLRLGYEVSREFMPYIGISRGKNMETLQLMQVTKVRMLKMRELLLVSIFGSNIINTK